MAEDEFVSSVSVNVEAIKDAGYTTGFNDGYVKGMEDRFNEGYRECLNDIIERLKSIMENDGKDYSECLLEIEKMST